MSDLERWLQRQAARERAGRDPRRGSPGRQALAVRLVPPALVLPQLRGRVDHARRHRPLPLPRAGVGQLPARPRRDRGHLARLGVLVGRARRPSRPSARPAPLGEPAPHPADDRRLARPDIAHLVRPARAPRRLDRLEPARRELRAGRGLRRRFARPACNRPADPHLPLGRLRAAPRLQAAARDPRARGAPARRDAHSVAADRGLGARRRRNAEHGRC